MSSMNEALAQVANREELINENNRLESELAAARHRIEWFKRQMFGSTSERFVPDDSQISLDLGVAPSETERTTTKTITYDRTTKTPTVGHGRGAMPTHLPIHDITIEPTEDVTGCTRIGEEITWQYEMKRGSLFVKRFIRPKYASKNHDAVTVAALPAQPIDKGNFGPAFMAGVTVDKFVYHLPLDRQRRKFKVEYRVDIAESTLCDVVRRSVFWLEPIYARTKEILQRTSYLMADETPIPVLTKDGKGKTHRGYFWVYYAPVERIVVFDYRASRSARGPCEFLSTYAGVLQTDGYAGYDEVALREDVIRAACMAHVRRKFEEALDSDRDRATHAIDVIRPWFTRETFAKETGASLDERFKTRLEKTVPEMIAFEQWLKDQVATLLPKSPLGTAVGYALNMWPRFNAFMTDARVELSNNLVENAIRPVALGRKNYMFMGSHDAAQRSAMIYSLVATANLRGLDPFVYVKHLLERLPGESSKNIDAYLPHRCEALPQNTEEDA